MEEEQYPFQTIWFYHIFNKNEEEPGFCLMQIRVLRQSVPLHFGARALFLHEVIMNSKKFYELRNFR